MNDLVHLLVFVKYPEAGLVKTRLARTMGELSAAQAYREWVEICLDRYRSIPNSRMTMFFDPKEKELLFRSWLGPEIEYLPQPQGDLGQRLSYGFTSMLKDGNNVIALGSDSPDLPLNYIKQAMDGLHNHDVVIGPAQDGGYYLIGLSKWIPELFESMAWSTATVFVETMNRVKKHSLSGLVLPQWYDIDTEADLERYRKQQDIS